jgi:hypothetical protein
VYGLEWQAFSDSMHEIDKEAFIELMNRLKHLAEADQKWEIRICSNLL